MILKTRVRNGKILSKVTISSDCFKVLQSVKDRWARNKNGGVFTDWPLLWLSLWPAVSKPLSFSSLTPNGKETVEPAQPTSLDCGKPWMDMNRFWELESTVKVPSSVRMKRKCGWYGYIFQGILRSPLTGFPKTREEIENEAPPEPAAPWKERAHSMGFGMGILPSWLCGTWSLPNKSELMNGCAGLCFVLFSFLQTLLWPQREI